MQIKKLVTLPSRTGRHLQRYNKGFRQVVGYVSVLWFLQLWWDFCKNWFHACFVWEISESGDVFCLPTTCLLNFLCGILFWFIFLFLEIVPDFASAFANLCRCIPYRIRNAEKSHLIDDITLDDLEILLISSQKSTRLMFPKVNKILMKKQDSCYSKYSENIFDPWFNIDWTHQGGWELDEDIEFAASRETLEEAGVVGQLGVS